MRQPSGAGAYGVYSKIGPVAGVSNTAVWRALHQQPKVSPEVRARIIALANEHHYHPNRLAEGFMTGKTHTVGLIVEHLSWQFDARLCDGVMHAAADDRAHVMIVNVTPGALPLSSLISQLIEQRVEGIIIAGGRRAISVKSVLEMWSHEIVPVSLMEISCDKPLDRITTDERRLAQTAVDYLLHLGHQRIAYCGVIGSGHAIRRCDESFGAKGISRWNFLSRRRI